MAIQSNFFRMTPLIMVEYRTDLYDIINSIKSSDTQPSKYYVYKGLDGDIYYTETPRYKDITGYNRFKNQAFYQKFPDKSRSEYYWFRPNDITPSNVTTLIDELNNSLYVDESVTCDNVYQNFHYDSVNIYFIRGFNLDELDGFELRVKSKCLHKVNENGYIYTEDKEFTIMDFYLDKNIMTGEMVHYLSTPIYMNSKFYDRYITVEFPSIYSVAIEHEKAVKNRYTYMSNNGIDVNKLTDINKFFPEEYNSESYNMHYPFYLLDENNEKDYYVVNESSSVIIEFATVSEGNASMVAYNALNSESGIYNNSLSLLKYSFILDPIDEGSINVQSNSDFFNVCIYEDKTNNEIVYYPTYGELGNSSELSSAIMALIESGSIHIVANGFYDLDRTTDYNSLDYNSEKLYVADSDADLTKWKIYNDLSVSYIYRNITASAEPTNDEFVAYEESYSRIIDYSKGSDDNSQFWRSYFTPRYRQISGANQVKVCMKYTCRLVNELMGVEAIRIASLFVDAPNTSYVKPQLNINTYKIINQINRTSSTQVIQQETVKEKYVRSYYNITNLVAKNIGTGGTIYNLGQMTLRLYRTSNNYAIQLYNINSDNVRIPYDLTGPYQYKIVFTASGSSSISISPNSDSADLNLGIGMLIFYITKELAELIMNMESTSRRFAIMTDLKNNSAQESTLYEGTVDWLS